MSVTREQVIRRVITRVCELPDRTSPDDWPEAMLVTDNELHDILDYAGERMTAVHKLLGERMRLAGEHYALASRRDYESQERAHRIRLKLYGLNRQYDEAWRGAIQAIAEATP